MALYSRTGCLDSLERSLLPLLHFLHGDKDGDIMSIASLETVDCPWSRRSDRS
ncbi:hypothetical protein ACRALDRAFT_1065893 [Sodiomyces alcalophilus JCM 7366]|uniref:uncharacterized protein n=1 Tax=Sodiomyces alcalophilus JCM 7366 TaxID=591952 RepID=UPI0039B6DC47